MLIVVLRGPHFTVQATTDLAHGQTGSNMPHGIVVSGNELSC